MINEDRPGLDVIYLQAKRWKENVGRKEIQALVGTRAENPANKGVFVMTNKFSKNAIAYATAVPQKVNPIDGERLGELMTK